MIDFSKIYCKLHPYELVTNFCAKDQCLIGLCATCICNHTQIHLKNDTIPQYQNIRTTFTQMHKKIRKNIQDLQNDKQRINNVINGIDKKKNTIKNQIQNTKKQCIQFINQYFDNYNKQVDQCITNDSNKCGYHSPYRLDTVSNQITKQITNLINSAQQLNSSNFLDCIKRIKKQILINSFICHKQIAKQILQNQQYQPNIQKSINIFNDIKILFKKLFTIKFNYPSYKIQQNNNQHNQKKVQNKFISQTPTQKSIGYSSQNNIINNNKNQTHKQTNTYSYQFYKPTNSQQMIQSCTFNNLSQTNFNNNRTFSPNLKNNYSVIINRESNVGRSLPKKIDQNNSIVYKNIPIFTKIIPAYTVNSTILSPNNYMTNSSTILNTNSTILRNNSQVIHQYPIQNQPLKKFTFVPQYIDQFNSKQQQPIQQKKRNNSSKKGGLTLYSTSKISSQASKQNISLADSAHRKVNP